jgi:hypothetical protein
LEKTEAHISNFPSPFGGQKPEIMAKERRKEDVGEGLYTSLQELAVRI